MIIDYIATIGYSLIFIANGLSFSNKSPLELLALLLILTSTCAFSIYYYTSASTNKTTITDNRQLQIKQLAHTSIILFLLFSIFILEKSKYFYYIGILANSLLLYAITTNTSLFLGTLLLAIFFGLFAIHNYIMHGSHIAMLGQAILFMYFMEKTYTFFK